MTSLEEQTLEENQLVNVVPGQLFQPLTSEFESGTELFLSELIKSRKELTETIQDKLMLNRVEAEN